MFSFHKPKVYRSSTGCCICKAKSSSSRFTDSKKYEDDFVECFQLQERRTGEICNACVLLVKRWKKLPPGSDRNWRHVVDARAGPGIKSLTKFKSKNKKKMKDKIDKSDKIVKKKHVYSKDMKMEIDREQSPARSDDMSEYYNVIRPDSKNSSRSESPMDSDDIIEKPLDVAPVECAVTKENIQDHVNDFIDLSYFKRQDTCCGPIFKGLYGEVIVDAALFKPCVSCSEAKRQRRQISDSSSASETTSPVHSASTSPAHSVESLPSSSETSISKQTQVSKNNTFSDSSSDSGYDEYSNQGADGGKKNIQKIKVLPSSIEQMDEISRNSLTGATNVTISPLQVPQSVSSN